MSRGVGSATAGSGLSIKLESENAKPRARTPRHAMLGRSHIPFVKSICDRGSSAGAGNSSGPGGPRVHAPSALRPALLAPLSENRSLPLRVLETSPEALSRAC
jgi:hypothetical protein